MGIGGQGISAVAQMARQAGNTVTGCDRQASATTHMLERAGIAVVIGHNPEHVVAEDADIDALVISPAVTALDPDNPELVGARQRGVEVITWQELLGELMCGKCLLSVCGVHGKGTTTAMLALILVDAGLDPTVEIGAVVPRFGANYRLGQSQYAVNEADEFNHNFWHYHPRLVVVTSIEFEHPEFFADYEAFLAAFEHFIRGMDMSGDWSLPPTVVLNADSPGCLELRDRLSDWPGRIVTYAVEGRAMPHTEGAAASIEREQVTFQAFEMKLEGETRFRVRGPHGREEAFDLQLPGAHNVQNALAALTVAFLLGVDAETIKKTLEGFSGIRRRFEIRHAGTLTVAGEDGQIRQVEDIILVDDYAHHPTAIEATLQAARQRYPERRLVAVYQPHMFSRTKTFFAQFRTAFDAADVALIADIFPARERDTGLISSPDLVAAIAQQPAFASREREVIASGGVRETARTLRRVLRAGDLVLIMGAGDIYIVTETLLQDSNTEHEE
ncbi:MAG TPA: UDP-N-acetylmuramate--L-alanine ligase [Ktedonobacteraceae bacterium]|nr:UDP-N-acetylmuramate--L-alanine ligase [Ktedonobacteraceae bacterium]